ncbi:MAG: STAS domain-containing protein [Gammaproteobacteria bacterium]
MTKHADITWEENTFVLSGELTFLNVMSVYEKSLPLFASVPSIPLDCANLQSSDSSGLALILEWKKWALQYGKSFQVSHFPENLLSIAKAAGLEELL